MRLGFVSHRLAILAAYEELRPDRPKGERWERWLIVMGPSIVWTAAEVTRRDRPFLCRAACSPVNQN